MTNFKVCCITTNPEQFKVEMEAVFGESKVLMCKRPRLESGTMIHLGFTSENNLSVDKLSSFIPSYVHKSFNFDIQLN